MYQLIHLAIISPVLHFLKGYLRYLMCKELKTSCSFILLYVLYYLKDPS